MKNKSSWITGIGLLTSLGFGFLPAEGRNRVSGITFASVAKFLFRNPVSLSPRRRQKPGFWNNLCIGSEIFVQKPGFFIPAPPAETGFLE